MIQDQFKKFTDEEIIPHANEWHLKDDLIPDLSEAKEAVSATRYPPLGSRGVGLDRAQGYGTQFKEYLDWQVKGPIVIAQIESINAVNNLNEIFGVKKLILFFVFQSGTDIGFNDLLIFFNLIDRSFSKDSSPRHTDHGVT